MNAFENASQTEEKGVQLLLPYVEAKADNGRYVFTDGKPLGKWLQKMVGDCLVKTEAGLLVGIDFKIEEENKTGNLFLETWSNRSRWTQGWMWTAHYTQLWYFFIASDELFIMDYRRLREWAFIDPGRNRHPGRVWDFPERKQGKRQQKNDTWGRCVPIRVIEGEVGFLPIPDPKKQLEPVF